MPLQFILISNWNVSNHDWQASQYSFIVSLTSSAILHMSILCARRAFRVLFESLPQPNITQRLIITALCGLIIRLVLFPFKIREPALEVKEIPSAEAVEFAEDEGFVAWISSYPSIQNRKTRPLSCVFDVH